MKNIYDGIATLDPQGNATVKLPDWFGALNQDFRYQLTCIGGYAPVYVAQEIRDNAFQIAGGQPGMRVSWQVTGVRHDPYAEKYRIQVETAKGPGEKGLYQHPDVYGQSGEKGIQFAAPGTKAALLLDAKASSVLALPMQAVSSAAAPAPAQPAEVTSAKAAGATGGK